MSDNPATQFTRSWARPLNLTRYLSFVIAIVAIVAAITATSHDSTLRTAEAQTFTSVCDRNAGIRTAILTALTSVTNCANVTAAHLRTIVTIDASNSSITSLAAADFDSLRPQHLLLANNQLSAVPTAVVQLMTHSGFSTLDLSNNQITQLNQNDFSGATHLRTLTLSGNDFSGATALHKDALDPLINLTQLYVDNAGIANLPAEFLDSLTKLEIFEAKSNSLTGLPTGIFDNNTALKFVVLSGNDLANIDKDTFKSNVRLLTINLEDNALTTLHADTFQHNTALRVLYLSQNQLTAINSQWFRNLSDLNLLSLRGNMIASLPANAFATTSDGRTFSGPTRLNQIILRDNAITTIHPDAFNGLNLGQLSLNDNNIAAIPRGTFDSMTRLQTLHLYNNQIARLDAGTFDNQANLEALRLDANQIQSIPPGTFNNLGNLAFLRLDLNQIDSIHADAFANLSRLRFLYLNNNRITRLPPTLFRSMTVLRVLYLQSNRINEISANTFSRLANLTDLWIQRNAIQQVHADAFTGMVSVDQLLLFSNQIQSLPHGVFDGLAPDMLWLQDNPGAPFQLPVRTNVRESDKAYIAIPHGAVYDVDVEFSATHAEPTANGAPTTSATVAAGTTASQSFDLNPAPGQLPRISVTPGSAPTTRCFSSPCYAGFQYVEGAPDPPTGVATKPLVSTVEVSWDKPGFADGVYYHEVRHRFVGGDWKVWKTVPLQDQPRQSTSIQNLATTTPYNFQVRSYSINGFSPPASANAWTFVNLPVISRIEPQIVSATVVTGQQVRLTANVFNMQDTGANARFDLQTRQFATNRPQLQWADGTGDGAFTQTDTPRTVYYTAPVTPSTVIVTAEAVPYGVCRGHHASPAVTSDCIATFTIQVVVPGDTTSPPQSQPRNPSGQIPDSLSDDAVNVYEVATPEQGGRYQDENCETCPTVTIPIGAVPNQTVIGVRATTYAATPMDQGANSQLVISNLHTRVVAIDRQGKPLTNYRLNIPMQVCVPFPPAFRSRLDSAALFEFADVPSGNRLLASDIYTRNGKLTLCGKTDRLPTTLAPARLGGTEPSHTAESLTIHPPNAGGRAPAPVIAVIATIAALLMIAISFVGNRVIVAQRGSRPVGRAPRYR